jgi:hypothetical protein
MRNRTRLIGVLVIAVVGVFTAMSVAWGVNTTQTITGNVSPNKLPKKKFKNVALNTAVSTDTSPRGGALDPANRALIDFDDDIKFNTKGVPTCTVARISGLPAAAARDECRRAMIGTGHATVRVGTTPVDATVSAFNAKRKKILLHADAGFTQTVLVGKLVDSHAGRDYGKALDVNVPALPGGAAVSRFQVRVKHGKYVRARCHDKNRKLNYKGKFFFDGYSLSASDTSSCKIKR